MTGWLQWLRRLGWTRRPETPRPEAQGPLAALRELLFADEGLESVARYAVTRRQRGADDPWWFFARAADRVREGHPRLAIRELRGLLELADLDSRSRLLAWHCLRQLGEAPGRVEAGRVLGIIIEGDTPRGPDILAAYEDGTARLLPPGGAFLMFEKPSPPMQLAIRQFLRTGRALAEARRPTRGPRPAPPSGTRCRVSVLTPAGHRIHQGERDVLRRDARVGPVLRAAEALARGLSAQVELAGSTWEEKLPGPPGRDGAGTGGPVVH